MDKFRDSEKNKRIVEKLYNNFLKDQNSSPSNFFTSVKLLYHEEYPKLSKLRFESHETVHFHFDHLLKTNQVEVLFREYFSKKKMKMMKDKICTHPSIDNEGHYFWLHEICKIGSNELQHRIFDFISSEDNFLRLVFSLDGNAKSPIHYLIEATDHPSIISKVFFLVEKESNNKDDIGNNNEKKNKSFKNYLMFFVKFPVALKYIENLIMKGIKRNNLYCIKMCFQLIRLNFISSIRKKGVNEENEKEEGKNIDRNLLFEMFRTKLKWYSYFAKCCIYGHLKSFKFLFQLVHHFDKTKELDKSEIFKLILTKNGLMENTTLSPFPMDGLKKNENDKRSSSIGLIEIILKNNRIPWEERKFQFLKILLPNMRQVKSNILNEEILKTVNYDEFSPLHYAVAHNNMKLVKLFHEFGSDLEKTCFKSRKSVNDSFEENRYNFFQKNSNPLLLSGSDSKSDIESDRDENENDSLTLKTALSLGIFLNVNYDIVEYLVKNGSKVDPTENRSVLKIANSLLLAIKYRRKRVISLLLNHGASIDFFLDVKKKENILHYLCKKESLWDMLDYIIEKHLKDHRVFKKLISSKDSDEKYPCQVYNQKLKEFNNRLKKIHTNNSEDISFIFKKDEKRNGRLQEVLLYNKNEEKNLKEERKKINQTRYGIKVIDTFYEKNLSIKESFIWKIRRKEFIKINSKNMNKSIVKKNRRKKQKFIIKSPNFLVFNYFFYLKVHLCDDLQSKTKTGVNKMTNLTDLNFQIEIGFLDKLHEMDNFDYFINFELEYCFDHIMHEKKTKMSSLRMITRKVNYHINSNNIIKKSRKNKKRNPVRNGGFGRKGDWNKTIIGRSDGKNKIMEKDGREKDKTSKIREKYKLKNFYRECKHFVYFKITFLNLKIIFKKM